MPKKIGLPKKEECSALLLITRSRLGLYTSHFLQICNRNMALDWCQNFVSAQYLVN